MKKVRNHIFILIIIIVILIPNVNFADDEAEEVDYKELNEIIVEASSNPTDEPKINSRKAVVFDRNSKTILYGKEENTKCAMASTTKIMTAIVVLENANLTEMVEVSKKAAGTGGSRLGLKSGDKITVLDLLYGLMMCSGNDAAVALAEKVGGNIEGFSILMNNKAKDLNLQSTNFVTPHGLDKPEHYTTAYELAKITDYALNNKKFANIVNTKNYTVNINGSPKNINNTNELLGVLEGVNGVKTGFTNGAGRCLVTSVNRQNMNIICVVLGADTKKMRTSDSIKLIEYIYKNFEQIELKDKIEEEFEKWKQTEACNIKIIKGKQVPEYKINNLGNTKIPIKHENIKDIKIIITNKEKMESPILENTVMGQIKVMVKDKKLYNTDIVLQKNIDKKGIIDYFIQLNSQFVDVLQINLQKGI